MTSSPATVARGVRLERWQHEAAHAAAPSRPLPGRAPSEPITLGDLGLAQLAQRIAMPCWTSVPSPLW